MQKINENMAIRNMLIKKMFYQPMRKYHRIIGLFVAIHFIILSLSGLILLFKSEIQRANPPIQTVMNQYQFAEKYDRANRYLLNQYPNDKPLDIYPDENNSQIIQARLGINGDNKIRGARIVNIDYQSEKEIKAIDQPYNTLYEWLLTLHHQLFLGKKGQIYLGIVGIAFILMNLTGLIMFLKKRPRKLPAENSLTKYLYVHQYLGIICLCWGLLVGTTGILLAFNPIFTQRFQKNILLPLAKKYQIETKMNQPDAPLKSIIHTAFKTKPNGVIWYIVFPGMERGISNHYLILIHGNGFFSQYISDYLVINAKTAELKEIIHLPLSMQFVLIATPFHKANYGGLLLKIIWTLFALGTLSFIILGILIFFKRKTQLFLIKNKSEKLSDSGIAKLADVHAITCFMNSLLREWNEYVVYQSIDYLFISIKTSDNEYLDIPLSKYSMLGRHEYTGQFHLKINNKSKEISFNEFLDRIIIKLEKIYSMSLQQLKQDVLSSRNHVYEALKIHANINDEPFHFINAEQSLVIGHQFHPIPKSRNQLTLKEQSQYSPELKGQFQLQWLWVDTEILWHVQAKNIDDKNWLNTLFSQDYSKRSWNIPKHMQPVPMHPWQWQRLQKNSVIMEYLKNKKIVPLDLISFPWTATSSLRTIYRDNCPYMLKFSMNLKITNSLRVLLSSEVARGILLHDVLATEPGKKFLKEFPNFHIITEPAYLCLVDQQGQAMTDTMLVCRHNPFNDFNAQNQFMLASLTQDNPFGGPSLLLKMIQPVHQQLKKWFDDYLQIVVKPLLIAYAKYGIIMEGHQQNIVLSLENGFPIAAYFRDCQDHAYSEYGYQLFSGHIPNLKAHSYFVADKVVGCHYFIYQVMLNSTFNVITTLAKSQEIQERELLSDLYQLIKTVKNQDMQDHYCLDLLLSHQTLLHKCNFKLALTQVNDNQLPSHPLDFYTHVPNFILLSKSHSVQKNQYSILYQRYFSDIKKIITFRLFDIEQDLKKFIVWHKKPRIAKYWQLDKDFEETEKYLQKILLNPHYQAVIIEMDHESIGYAEFYWAAYDLISHYYDYHDTDRGFHMLIGEDQFLGVKNTKAIFQAIMDYLYLSNHKTQRLVVEPDKNNQRFIKYMGLLPGWKLIKEVNLPDKQAAMFISHRNDFILENGL